MARKPKSVSNLLQNDNVWYCAVRRLRGWVEKEKGEGYLRPYSLIIVELKSGMFLNMDLFEQAPSPEDIGIKLINSMLKPGKLSGLKPHRPAEIHFEDERLAADLEPLLAETRVGIRYLPQRENMDALIGRLEESVFFEKEEYPGLLDQRGVTPEQVEALYRAAAAFYRAEPWVHLSNMELLSIQAPPQKKPFLAVFMGQGGVE
jgi:hypothetical protein